MRTKVLSLLLAVVIVAALLPAMTLGSAATDERDVCTVNGTLNYTYLEEAISDANSGQFGNEVVITLLRNAEFNGSVELLNCNYVIESGDNNVLLTLTGPMKLGDNNGGHYFTFRGNQEKDTFLAITPEQTDGKNSFRPIAIRSGNTLTVEAGTGLCDSNFEGGLGGMINVASAATLNLNGGVISSCSASQGGAISVAKNGYCRIQSGKIRNCSADKGGAVYVANGGKLEMYGGMIDECSAEKGGAVFVEYNALFKMNDGTIKDCTVKNKTAAAVANSSTEAAGGGVYVIGSMTFDQGVITECVAECGKGGGVYVYPESGVLEMNGGAITLCSATENDDEDLYYNDGEGGGVYVGRTRDAGAYNVSFGSCEIYSNSAKEGSGVYIHENGSAAISFTPVIFGNLTSNVYLSDNSFLVLTIGTSYSHGGSDIGVTTASAPTSGNPVPFTDSGSYSDYVKLFSSDNENYYVSEDQDNHLVLILKEKENTPEATFSATGADTGTLGNLSSGMKYKIDDGDWQTASGTSQDLTGLGACTITVYMPGNGTTTVDSDAETVSVTKADTPNLTVIQPATINNTGSVATTSAHQKSTDGVNWEDCSGPWNNLGEGTYYVRVKASGTVLASDAQTVVIEVPKHTVKFVNWDGTELQSSEVACGDIPEYTGAEPEKEATAKYTYYFAGWDPDISAVTQDAAYTATFNGEINKYTVTFAADEGSDAEYVTVNYGDSVAEPEAPEKKSFTFAGWYADKSLETPFDFSSEIVGDTTIYAKWIPVVYTVKADVKWTKGGEDAGISVQRSAADETSLDHLEGIKIDGKELVKGTDYKAEQGSGVITVKAAALEKLSVGEHKITVVFDDGEAEASLTVKAAPTDNAGTSPKTGYDGNTALVTVIMTVSVLGVALAFGIGLKKKVFGK